MRGATLALLLLAQVNGAMPDAEVEYQKAVTECTAMLFRKALREGRLELDRESGHRKSLAFEAKCERALGSLVEN